MALNPQTSNFPPIYLPEQSFGRNLAKSMELLAPGEGIRAGLEMGFPLDGGGLVTTGLTPTLTDGYLMTGDQILGPYGSRLTKAAEAGWTQKNVFFGLQGLNYGDVNNAAPSPHDLLIGQITTDSEDPASILYLGQQYNYGACRFGVRGLVNLAKVGTGDTTFFTWTVPEIGLKHVRVVYAEARVAEAVSAGNDTGDDFILKVKKDTDSAISLATIAAAGLGTLDTTTRNVSADADAVSWHDAEALAFQFNQTDGTTAIAGGAVECMVLLEMF